MAVVLSLAVPAALAHDPGTKLFDLREEPTAFLQLDGEDNGEQAHVYAGAPCPRTDLHRVDVNRFHRFGHQTRVRFKLADLAGSCPMPPGADSLWFGYGLTGEAQDSEEDRHFDSYTVVYWHSPTLEDRVTVAWTDDGQHEEGLCRDCVGPVDVAESTVTLTGVGEGEPPFRDATFFAVSCTVPTLVCSDTSWSTTSSTLMHVDAAPSLHDACLFCPTPEEDRQVFGGLLW